ncbi:unnamed protein product (macronuclear) [Paramecium tetraurelia]|uniref:Uncharacterized protein n=1 Tax=Paramecium tetraurelia TaxID=5888 RepID=A0CPG1_PARTE|nr:uncharacterized protein GSPATT00009070001 [Paramecium tetraurelia]CAK72678.1 unnamed protein product [Paramecium tetraurelia]|eukprot:XP_001440075.1 hypothetical protein (macronuclear) [Paramecium tetraurelia strain d4-2]
MEFRIHDRIAKVYELKLINDTQNIKTIIKFFTNYNIGRKLSPLEFFETLLVFSVQQIVLIIRINQYLQTVEIHKCPFSGIENSIKNDKQYHIISSFMIESIECQINKSAMPYFLDSQYFYFIINQDIIQYNLASLLTSQSSPITMLKRNLIQAPIYFRDDFIHIKNQDYLYSIQRYGYQISHTKFLLNMQQINLQTDTFKNVQIEIVVTSINITNIDLIQSPFINQVIFETNEITLEIQIQFEGTLIKQNYSLSENSDFDFQNEEREEINFVKEPGLIQIWNLDQKYDQVYSLILY